MISRSVPIALAAFGVSLALPALAADKSSSSSMATIGGPAPQAPALSLPPAAAAAAKPSPDSGGTAAISKPPATSAEPPKLTSSGSPVASSKSEAYAFQICNRSGQLAAATASYQSPTGRGWDVAGWWRVEPGNCMQIGRFEPGWVYFYAETENGGYWGAETLKKCVRYPGPFQRHEEPGSSYTCQAGEQIKGFNGVFVDGDVGTYTWTLNN